MAQNNIRFVKGNTLPIAVALQIKTAVDGQWVTEDYNPPVGSEIHAYLVGRYKRWEYDCTLDGNIVRFIDDGLLSIGDYGVEITVKEPSDTNRRTFKCNQIKIVNCTDEIGMLPDGEVILDAAIFIQGEKGEKGDKGDKGDKGSDANVTEENIESALGYKPASPTDIFPTVEEFNQIFN